MARLTHCKLPEAHRLGYTTPSGAMALEGCKLRAAYGSDPSFRAQVPSSPAARIGNVAHRVLELAGMGALGSSEEDGWRARFDAAWDEALLAEDSACRENPVEAHWPSPAKWPNVSLRKVATRRLAQNVCKGRKSNSSSAPSSTVQEQWQEALDGRLRGRADVIRRGSEPEIEDYKTGSLYEEDGEEVKAQYRLQLLLYAVLEHATTGVWPKRATLVPLEGQPATMEVDAAQARAAAANALRALDDYNAAIDDARPLKEIASPDVDTCRFCPFSIQCPAFWSAIEPGWAEGGILALAGRIEKREESRLNTFSLIVHRESGSVPDGDYLVHQLDAERFYELRIAPGGSTVAFVGLIGEADSFHLKASTRTRALVAEG